MRSQKKLPPDDTIGNLLRKINEADARSLTDPCWHSHRETAKSVRACTIAGHVLGETQKEAGKCENVD